MLNVCFIDYLGGPPDTLDYFVFVASVAYSFRLALKT
jgi:hypothetical protein